MLIDLYHSAIKPLKMLIVPHGINLQWLELPEDFDVDLRQLSPFSATLEIIPEMPYFALNANDIVEQLKQNGFAIYTVKITVKM